MTATIKDVARLAGVSISTVSRVINNSKPVSDEVRHKVLKAIEELGYKPNEVARSLVTRKSKLIGVIVTDIGNSYIAEMVRGIEEIGRMYKYDIILSSSYGDANTEKKFVQFLVSKQVEGIIVISEINDSNVIDEIKAYNTPLIYLNKYYTNINFPSVSIDAFKASVAMTEYLFELGHENLLFVTYNSNDEDSIEKYKIDGYNKVVEEKGCGNSFLYTAEGNTIQNGYDMGASVLNLVKEKEITAVFCGQDELAIGLMSYCYDNKIIIPDDISICGYGDIEIASIYRPRLTTVKEPYYDIGAVAIRRIIKQINGEKLDEENIFLPIKIIKRESCKELK